MSMGQENKMTDEYKPTRKEVLGEIGTSLGKNFSNAYKRLTEFGGSGLFSFGVLLATPYCLPTAARKFRKFDSVEQTNAEIDGTTAGFVGGGMVTLLEFAGYNYLYRHDHAEVLAIPIATNVISGAYELGRVAYRNAKQRLIERHGKEISDAVDDSPGIHNAADQNERN